MTTRTVSVQLEAKVGSYIAGMQNAARATRDVTNATLDTAEKHKQEFTQLGLAAGAVGLAAAAGVGAAVLQFADFDQKMSDVQAATHASAGEMNNLREAALDAGARTVFSATEAAAAIEELAKAGVSTTEILNGGLDGALDLAAAGGIEVADAAEIAATALKQFGLTGAQIPHVADLLAAAAGKAQGGVSDMGMALKQAGLVASQSGLSIEETTAGLASFASAGLLGSDAGTSFKSMLQRLTPQSAEAEEKMRELGISAYDAQGNFVGLEAFAGNLQSSLEDLTVEQRNSAMATIFGSDAVRAASVLYSQGAEGIASWTAKVNDAGYAQETAAIKLDNLKGDVEEFTGSLETAFIKTGSAGDGMARTLVQGATAVVNTYGELPPVVQGGTLALGGLVAVAGTAAGGFLLMLPRIAETRAALVTLGISARATSLALGTLKWGLVGAGAAAASLGIFALIDSFEDAAPGVNALTGSLADFLRTGKATGDLAKIVGKDFSDLARTLDVADENKWLSWREGRNEIGEARKQIEALDQSLAAMVQSGHAEQAAEAFAQIMANRGDRTPDEVRADFEGYTGALEGMRAEALLAADSQDDLAAGVTDATGAVVEQTASLTELMEQVRALSDQILGLRGSNRAFESALDAASEAVKENGRTLDINTEKGRSNEAALDAVATSAADVLESMVASGKAASEVSDTFAIQRVQLIETAEAFGMTHEEAVAYTDSVLRIPSEAETAIQLHGAESAIARVEAFRSAIAGVPSLKNVTIRYNESTGITVGRGFGGRITERASGGAYSAGPLLVGEHGPEYLFPDVGGFVLNHRATLEAMNSMRLSPASLTPGIAPSSAGMSTARLEGELAGLRKDVVTLARAVVDRPMRFEYNNREVARLVADGQHLNDRRH